MGHIKPIFHPAVNLTSIRRCSKTTKEQFQTNKNLSRSYQNLPRYDIFRIDAALKTAKTHKEFTKLRPQIIKDNIQDISKTNKKTTKDYSKVVY